MTRYFLLTPDATSARRLRRTTAEHGATTSVVVGEWRSFIEHARASYLIPPLDERSCDWIPPLTEAMISLPGAFWSRSIKHSTHGVVEEIAHALRKLLVAVGPELSLEQTSDASLPSRTRKNFNDLVQVWGSINRKLPADLELERQLLQTDETNKYQELFAVYDSNMPSLNPWRRAVIDKINQNSEPAPSYIRELLYGITSPTPVAPATASNGVLSRTLFGSEGQDCPKDNSVQIVGARDFLEEVEIAAGMVQNLFEAGVTHSDIGVLIPSGGNYASAIKRVFGPVGIPLAGLPLRMTNRDTGREAVYYFLLAHSGPMPSMALATLLTNPLMPWDVSVGNFLATKVMRNDFSLKLPRNVPQDHIAMRDLIMEARSSEVDIAKQLSKFSTLITPNVNYPDAFPAAELTIYDVIDCLVEGPPTPIETLLSLARPEAVTNEEPVDWPIDGVAVFLENNEPWRLVRHLFVLGFQSGHYPMPHAGSPVFTARDLSELRDKIGISIRTPADELGDARMLFRRQIAAASDSVRLFTPRLDEMGGSISPSETLMFIGQTMTGTTDSEDLIVDVDNTERLNEISELAISPNEMPNPRRPVVIDDMSLGLNLLTIGARDGEEFRHQSPSSLEKLIVSPLAWLLSTLGAEPDPWKPDVLGPAVQGSIAHDVFEHLFVVGEPTPDATSIMAKMPGLMERAITHLFPVLRTGTWWVEYKNLTRQVQEAALRWREVLSDISGDVVANEVWLSGQMKDLPIRGGADSIISLPNGRILIVDFKKSSSPGRRKRMDMAFDSQAPLYRMMVETGGATDDEDSVLNKTLRDASEIGVLYYMMNDRISLTDQAEWFSNSAPGIASVGPDVSSSALVEITRRLNEVKKGDIPLNRLSDEKRMEKEMGIAAKYALEISPLVRSYTIDDSGEGI
jgi:ATP-dependent helicase/nuclease subunit B